MDDDKRAIEELVATWMEASTKGDIETVLSLMTDDIQFIVSGREPFGKDEFRGMSQQMSGAKVEGQAKIRDLRVMGDWAWISNHIEVSVTSPGGQRVHRSGYTLSILRRCEDGKWRLTRDANLVS